MNQADIIRFFDRAAQTWDAELICHPAVVEKILDGAGVAPGRTVLDVACGTGVLLPFYLRRQVRSVTGVDISPEMVRICREKFPRPEVEILCGDAETLALPGPFDCVMVYNAFPHFPDPEHLIAVLSRLVAPGGTLTVAHGMSREAINHIHRTGASQVSRGLPPAEVVAAWMARHLPVQCAVSDGEMYQVTALRPL